MEKLVAGTAAEPGGLDGPVLIYGAGAKGNAVADFLIGRSSNVLGFADEQMAGKANRHNLPVASIERWAQRALPRETIVLVAVHNPKNDVAAIFRRLAQLGFERTRSMVDLHRAYSLLLGDDFWLTDPRRYVDHVHDVARLEALLADEPSRRLLQALIAFRTSGNYDALPPPSLEDQYSPADLPRWPNPLAFIDCGAYDGDTIGAFRQLGYDFSQLAAFEPDPANFVRLTATAPACDLAIYLPCGVSDKTHMLKLSAQGNGSSRFSADGGTPVQCVALDDILPGFCPSLIKMDVEGAELAALRGARQMLARSRPGLAISAYHSFSDLWEIPRLIRDLQLGYRFHLRAHAFNSFDVVLYALP